MEKREHSCSWWECKLIQLLWRTVSKFLEKLKKNILSHDLVIPLKDIYPEKTINQKQTCTPVFIAPPFIIARTWKQTCPLTDEWIKMWCVCIYIYIEYIVIEYYSAIKRSETNL